MPRGQTSNNPHTAVTDHRIPRALPGASRRSSTHRQSAAAEAIANFHGDLMSTSELALAERDRAIALCQTGSKKAAELALPLLESALAAHPDDFSALEAKAQALGRLGRSADALAACQTLLAQDPTRETALVGAAYFASLAGKSPEAIEYWRRTIAVNPWRYDYRAELAMAEAAARDWKAAAADCREALRLNPFALPVRRRLVQSYLHLKEREAARRGRDHPGLRSPRSR